ncbi:MAG: hypothetical protein J6Z38_06100, partial [Lachnospiraceae bacterium]|nr:hypothetical protein [Lachnospiraceae bacterium]
DYDGEDSLTVTNVYDAKGEAVFEAKKELTGRTLKEGEFSFELKDADGNVLEVVPNDKDGKVVFTAIEYLLSADKDSLPLVYTISEAEGKVPGVTYTTGTLTVTVNFSDNGDGTLDVVVSYSGLIEQTFVNEYHAEGGIPFEAKKIYEGGELKDGQFSFELKDQKGTVLETVFNDADGKIVFTPVLVDETVFEEGKTEATLTFTLNEVIPEKPEEDIIYDDRIFTATVTLTDNGDGTISASVKWSVDGEAIEKPEIVNDSIPHTGDLNRWPAYLWVLLSSGLGFAAVLFLYRRRDER